MLPDKEVRLNDRRVEVGCLPVAVTTPYMDFEVGAQSASGRAPEIWARIKTHPAFEIAFLRPGSPPTVVLMKREQSGVELARPKFPGGYERPGETKAEKIRRDTGIAFDECDLVPTGHVLGHNTIETPIELFLTTEWQRADQPREGVVICEVTLLEAAAMAMGHELECDTSFTLAMRLYYLWVEKEL